MRVIAGNARGKRLFAPHGIHTRPTADRVKESLFSIIQSRYDLAGAKSLDICAGSGALGIEALSRGSACCCFIENDRNALKSLKQNLSLTGTSGRVDLLEMDVLKALPLLAGRGDRFNFIFFDPPYASELYPAILEMVSSLSLLDANGLLIAECGSRKVLLDRYGSLIKIDRRVYGDTALELFTKEEV
jgi:16S rRNA (guanine(966)-N(2))-methyltransferase RsmD